MKSNDVDPTIKRLFPWGLFLFLAVLFTLGAVSLAHGDGIPPGISCEDVVKRVGLKPLWLAEKLARKQHPEYTEDQIAWGKQCVIEHRQAMLQKLKDRF